jgi:GntR family transcriptional regulator
MTKIKETYDLSRVPLYIQVSSVMRQRIESNQWRSGEKIPALVELRKEFQVASVTVRQAVELLCEEGLLYCQQGRGTFVADKTLNRHWVTLATNWNLLIASIKENVLERINIDNPPAFPTLTEDEGKLAQGYTFLCTLQYKSGHPYSVVNLHLADHIFKRDPGAFLEHPALPVLVELNDIEVRQAHQTVVIGSANLEKAGLLKIALGAPTVESRCVVIDHAGVAIFVADITYRSEAVKLHLDLLASSDSLLRAADSQARDGSAS